MKVKYLRILLILLVALQSVNGFSQFLVPDYVRNYDGTKPTVYSTDLAGGYQEVADKTARNNIDSDKRAIGLMVTYGSGTDWVTEFFIGVNTSDINWQNDNNWLEVPNLTVKTDSSQISDTALYALKADSSNYADTSDFALNAIKDSNFVTINVSDTAFLASAQYGQSGTYMDSNKIITDSTSSTLLETKKVKFNSSAYVDSSYINLSDGSTGYFKTYLRPSSNQYFTSQFLNSSGTDIGLYQFQYNQFSLQTQKSTAFPVSSINGFSSGSISLSANYTSTDKAFIQMVGSVPYIDLYSKDADYQSHLLIYKTYLFYRGNSSADTMLYVDSNYVRAHKFKSDTTITNILQIGGGDLITSSDTVSLKTAVEATYFDSLTFDTTIRDGHRKGKLIYDKVTDGLMFHNSQDGFRWNIGREMTQRFYNASGSTLNEGDIVTTIGTYKTAEGDFIFSAGSAGNGSLDSLNGIAMVTVTTAAGEIGEATWAGRIHNLNTSAYTNNDIIFLGHNKGYSNIPFEPPYFYQIVGRILYADADSGVVFFYGFSPTSYNPNPDFSASFTRETQTITNSGINNADLITNATNDLYTEDLNYGFTFVGDTVQPKQNGAYSVDCSYAFQGDAATSDGWRIGVFVNGVEIFTVLRTSSTSNKGVVSFTKLINLTTSDWVSFRVINTTDDTRDSIFTDGTINFQYLSE